MWYLNLTDTSNMSISAAMTPALLLLLVGFSMIATSIASNAHKRGVSGRPMNPVITGMTYFALALAVAIFSVGIGIRTEDTI